MSSGTEDASAADSTPGSARRPRSTREANAPVAVRRRAAPAAIVGGEQHAFGAEAGVEAAPFLEPLEEQAGDDQHEQRERDLQPHQHLAHGTARPAAGSPGAACPADPGGTAATPASPRRRARRARQDADATARPTPSISGLEPDRQRAGDLAGPDGLRAPQRERPARCRCRPPTAGAPRAAPARRRAGAAPRAPAGRRSRAAGRWPAPAAGWRRCRRPRRSTSSITRLQQGQRAVDHPLRAARRIVEGVQLACRARRRSPDGCGPARARRRRARRRPPPGAVPARRRPRTA